MRGIILALAMMVTFAHKASAGLPPGSFTYQGKLYKANGIDPVESATVTFTIQVRSADGTCLLFEETHFRDMTGTAGIFTLIVGEGTNTNASALNLVEVFGNHEPMTGAAACAYSPLPGDTRRLRLTYSDGVTTVSLPTDQTIRSVPYAINSMSLQGRQVEDFITVNAGVTQAKVNALFAVDTALLSLAAGTSNLYLKPSDISVSSGVINVSTSGIKVADAPGAADHAINRNYADSRVGGRAVDLTGMSNGQTLLWNVAQNKWVVGTPNAGTITSIVAGTGLAGGTISTVGTISLATAGTAGTYAKVTTDAYGRVTAGAQLAAGDVTGAIGFSPVNKAGDTFSGDIAMSAHNITNTGFITMASNKYLGMGSYDAAAELNLVNNTLTPGGNTYAGVFWYNSASKVLKYWDGAQVVTSASTSNISSIPMASTVGVAAGLISHAEYSAFATKAYADTTVAGSSATIAGLNNTTDIGKVMTWSGTGFGWVAQDLAIPSSISGDVTGAFTASIVSKIRGVNVSMSAPANNQVLGYNATLAQWQPQTVTTGTVTMIVLGSGLVGGNISANGTISVDVGTTANKIVQLDGTGKLPQLDASNLVGGGFRNFQSFDADGTFVVPSGVTKVYVQIWGAGGGGGGGTVLLGGGASGGGAGGYAHAVITLGSSADVAVAVGAGGARGNLGGDGAVGGNSSFGAHITANGGQGGKDLTLVPTAGGSTTAASTLECDGGEGGPAQGGLGGAGGAACNGGGPAYGAVSQATNGSDGKAPGGGGGGGFGLLVGNSQGGKGANGRVIVWY